jgi:hypothetical protein
LNPPAPPVEITPTAPVQASDPKVSLPTSGTGDKPKETTNAPEPKPATSPVPQPKPEPKPIPEPPVPPVEPGKTDNS